MTSDLIMIILTIALLVVCIYGINTKFRVVAVIVLVLTIPPIFITLIVNYPMITSPFTPKVHGKVIDSETKKPLAGINIKAGWYVSSALASGSVSGQYYKVYKTETNNSGEFSLPSGLKALTIQVFPGFTVYERKFDTIHMTVYPQYHDYKVNRLQLDNKTTALSVSLERVRTDTEFLDNIKAYWHGLSCLHKNKRDVITEPYERAWLKNAYYRFEQLYPNSNADTESTLRDLANILEVMKEPDCIYLLKKLLQKYPNGTLSSYAKRNIESLEKMYLSK